jgi:hypothetical protein
MSALVQVVIDLADDQMRELASLAHRLQVTNA